MADEFDPLETPEQRIDRLASEPLVSTGKPPSPEAVAEAKRIARLAAPVEADPDEEPPDQPGHPLSPQMAASLDGLRHPDARKGAFRGTIPADLAAVWCPPRARVTDEQTCRVLLGAWGVEAFRASALHNAALQEMARDALSAEAKADMKKTIERKKAKR